jgi:hypothetical protein
LQYVEKYAKDVDMDEGGEEVDEPEEADGDADENEPIDSKPEDDQPQV